MRALIVETGRTVSPFGEVPHLAAYAGSTVGAAVRAALARRGIEVLDVKRADTVAAAGEPTLVLADHTFVSDKCLGDFLAVALDHVARGPVRLALARTPSVDATRPVGSVALEPFDATGPGAKPAKGFRVEGQATERCAYDCFLVPSLAAQPAAALLEELRAHATRVVVPKRELGIPLRLPILGDSSATRSVVPITSTVACHIEHWVHVLWLNQLAFGIRFMELARAHKLWAVGRLFAAFPWTSPHRFLRALVHKGRGVRIHPTAYVEGSILGDGVVIGARASVRNSIIGAGTEVGDHATVLSSVVGKDAFVTPRTFVVWCATYDDAVLSNYKVQVSLIGRGASLSTWAGLIDAKLQGAVDVKHDGVLRSTEKSFLGSCVGHGAYIGAKVLLLPGREVPNGAFIAMRPDELVHEVPPGMPPGVPHVRDGGTLVPLDTLLRAR